ncbi:MAG: YqeG family HAD IIIA-type phosphatase [Clostridia bacterium]|nr:YqeG family HAD IIIA-type phosphatase [Clostridia bacterium]
MAFLDRFTPDDVLPDVYAVTPEKCARLGIRAVVFDIDNTLAPYEVSAPDERLKAHLRSFPEAGISIALVSNNKPERVEIFNRELGFFAQPDAHKPSKRALAGVLAHFAPLSGQEILFVGDQLFTDVLTARKNGIRAITVPPIQPRENWFFRLKRALEKPVMRRYRRLEKQRKTEQIEKRK